MEILDRIVAGVRQAPGIVKVLSLLRRGELLDGICELGDGSSTIQLRGRTSPEQRLHRLDIVHELIAIR